MNFPSAYRTVFESHGLERLTEWKKFRDSLEISNSPLQDVLQFWSFAPFVNTYLDSNDPRSWPDPWRLLLDSRFDNLALVLGMLYTLQLTKRFMTTEFAIHRVLMDTKHDPDYFLSVERTHFLDIQTNTVEVYKDDLDIIWSNRKV